MTRKMVPFRLEAERMKELRLFCLSNETSVQKVLEEYVELLLKAKERGIDDLPTQIRSLIDKTPHQ